MRLGNSQDADRLREQLESCPTAMRLVSLRRKAVRTLENNPRVFLERRAGIWASWYSPKK